MIESPKPAFHYEIHADEGIAHDAITKANARAYLKVEIEVGHELTAEEFKQVHEIEAVELTARNLGINEVHLKPISESEFLANQDKNCLDAQFKHSVQYEPPKKMK